MIYRYLVGLPTIKIKRHTAPLSSSQISWRPNVLFVSKEVHRQAKKIMCEEATFTNDPVYISGQIPIGEILSKASHFRDICLKIQLIHQDITGTPSGLEHFVQQDSSALSHRSEASDVDLKFDFSASLKSMCTFWLLQMQVWLNRIPGDIDPFCPLPPLLTLKNEIILKLASAWLRAHTLAAIERVRSTLHGLNFKVKLTTDADSDPRRYAVLVRWMSDDEM